MSEPFLGEIRSFGFNFAPRGWAFCDGQLLSIAENSALFSLLGTQYGGDGRTSFGLPDLRGRSQMHQGSGPGLTPRVMGQKLGAETHTLSVGQMPAHNHRLEGETTLADSRNPNNKMLALSDNNVYARPIAEDNRVMANESITNTGGGQAFNIVDPHQVVNMCIALVGIFPSRS